MDAAKRLLAEAVIRASRSPAWRHRIGGKKPADPPVQQPTKFELVLAMKTANVLGLTLSPQFFARVDRVID
jgi:hypothetical protein